MILYQTQVADVDVGLRQYMLGVYNYMSLGVAFTGIVALVVAMSPALMEALVFSPLKWVLFGGVLLSGFVAPRVMMKGSIAACHAMFWIYAAMWGALMAPMFLIYTGESMVRVFFITAAAFAALSLYGYTTKRDLAPIGALAPARSTTRREMQARMSGPAVPIRMNRRRLFRSRRR